MVGLATQKRDFSAQGLQGHGAALAIKQAQCQYAQNLPLLREMRNEILNRLDPSPAPAQGSVFGECYSDLSGDVWLPDGTKAPSYFAQAYNDIEAATHSPTVGVASSVISAGLVGGATLINPALGMATAGVLAAKDGFDFMGTDPSSRGLMKLLNRVNENIKELEDQPIALAQNAQINYAVNNEQSTKSEGYNRQQEQQFKYYNPSLMMA